MRRLAILWGDQLAGHWVEDVTVETTGLPPPNVEAYHLQNLIPHISSLIEDGIWVRYSFAGHKNTSEENYSTFLLARITLLKKARQMRGFLVTT